MGSHLGSPARGDAGAVVFDAVGTLIHPEPPAAVVYADVGGRHGSRLRADEIAPRFRAAFDREEAHDREHGFCTSEAREWERWRRIVADVLDDVTDREACFRELFSYFSRPEAWQCDPQAAATLVGLAAQGYTLGLASNYDQRLRTVTAGLPDLKPIAHVVISSEVGWRKPASEFFATLCRRVNLPAERILFVGDDLDNDYNGARQAGLRAVLLDRKGDAARSAPARVASLRDLLDGEW